MRIFNLFILLFLIHLCASAQKLDSVNSTLARNVDLRGGVATVTVANNTSDTVKLRGAIALYLPIYEQLIEEDIAPGKSSVIKVKMNYPDFIQFTSVPFSIYAAPGKMVKCTIERVVPLKISFQGDFSAENEYYQAYFKAALSNHVYYQAGSHISNMNTFPALADSITNINLSFLKSYKSPLSSSFKEQEYWRLMYNNAFLKHHVPFDLAFKSGKDFHLDDSYYKFDREVPLTGQSALLSSEYLWYAVFRLRDIAAKENRADSLLPAAMLAAAEKEYRRNEIGDAVKMRLLYDAYARSESSYQNLLRQVTFANPQNKQILDSVAQARFSLPLVGKKAPGFRLLSLAGDTVSLSQFKDHLIIVNFWASWCAPCIKQFPSENKLYTSYKESRNLVVINICIDTPFDTWKTFSAKHHLQMVNLFADEKQAKYLKKVYNISSLPKSVLIDRNLSTANNNFKRASEVKVTDLE